LYSQAEADHVTSKPEAERTNERLLDQSGKAQRAQNLRPDDGLGNSYPFDSGKHGTDPHYTYVLEEKFLPRPGGFITSEIELMKTIFQNFKALSENQMLERVNAMDGQAQSLRALAEKLQRKLNECTDHTAVIHRTAKLKPILEGVEREIDAL
jgi:hypothetical protein